VLQEHGEMYRHDAIDAVIRKTGLTDEQLALVHETNGKSVARGRISWAASWLKLAGALVMPKRSYFALGPTAAQFLSLDRPIKVSDIKATPQWQAHYQDKAQQSAAVSATDQPTELSDATPEDLIETGFTQLRQQLVADLLDRIKSVSPEAFERLVLQVLAKMGYGGGSLQSMQGVARGPDGGIDGRINEDKLGLDQIYIQAKRYADNSVGRPTVQSFVGAMTGGGCKKGVFVTSSTFTADAQKFASDLHDQRLVLIDGIALARLMIDYGVGVEVKEVFKVAKIDQDFFADDD
jgi:restriction system protein